MHSPLKKGFQKRRYAERLFFFSGDITDRFEPALVRIQPGKADRVCRSTAFPFRPGLLCSGHEPGVTEWEV